MLDAARRVRPGLDTVPGLTLTVADGRALAWPDDAFDVAHCSLVVHHLDEEAAVGLLREMARVARRGVIVNDLARGRLAWLGAWLLAHLATANRYTRHDARAVRAARVLAAGGAGAAGDRRPATGRRDSGLLGHRWAIGAAIA